MDSCGRSRSITVRRVERILGLGVRTVPYDLEVAWGSKRRREDAVGGLVGSVESFTSGSSMIVEGSPTAVSAFIDQMLDATKEVGGQSRHFVADGLQVAANVAAFRQTHREYFDFSERGRKLLKGHGAISTKDGNYRSFVHNGKHLAGHLDWKPVKLGASRP